MFFATIKQLWGELAYEMWLFPDSRLQLVLRVGLALGYQHVGVTLPGEDDATSFGIPSAIEINLRSVALDGLGIEHMPATALRANYHLQGFSVEHSAERALHHYLRLYASLYLSLGT